MNNPLLDQFQNWMKQLESLPETSFTEQLAQWQQWIAKFQHQTEELSPNHADLVASLTAHSAELVELLADLTRARAHGTDVSGLVERLRSELHQFNLRHILERATLPHQFLELLFTQQGISATYSPEQLEQLRAVTAQLKHPRFAKFKALLEALIGWQEAVGRLNRQLDAVSTAAIEQFTREAQDSFEQEQLLALWVNCYDQTYREAFNHSELPAAQAELVNSLTQLQSCWQALIEQFADQLGLPRRSEIDQLIEQFDQQRRRIRALELEIEQLKASQN